MLARDKRSSLLQKFATYGCKSFLTLAPNFGLASKCIPKYRTLKNTLDRDVLEIYILLCVWFGSSYNSHHGQT